MKLQLLYFESFMRGLMKMGVKNSIREKCKHLKPEVQQCVYNLRHIRPMSRDTFLVKASLH